MVGDPAHDFSPELRREAGANAPGEVQAALLEIAHEDRVEVRGVGLVATDDELLTWAELDLQARAGRSAPASMIWLESQAPGEDRGRAYEIAQAVSAVRRRWPSGRSRCRSGARSSRALGRRSRRRLNALYRRLAPAMAVQQLTAVGGTKKGHNFRDKCCRAHRQLPDPRRISSGSAP
jgi:hypothetical protein